MCAARHLEINPGVARVGSSITLAELALGTPAIVTDVSPEPAAELLREGVLAGVSVTVVARAPLGGPLILRVGRRARVAISRDLARDVMVRVEAPRGTT